MDKFFNSTFDALTNVLPGAFVLFVIAFATTQDLQELIVFSKELSLGLGAVLVFVAYLIGFTITPIGRYVFTKLGLKLFPVVYLDTTKTDLTISEKFSLVREHSPSNFRYIETWNMFSTLSYTLSIGFISLAFAAIYKMTLSNADITSLTLILTVSLIFSLLLLKRASVFKKWAADDMNGCINALYLIEKVKPGVKTQKIIIESDTEIKLPIS